MAKKEIRGSVQVDNTTIGDPLPDRYKDVKTAQTVEELKLMMVDQHAEFSAALADMENRYQQKINQIARTAHSSMGPDKVHDVIQKLNDCTKSLSRLERYFNDIDKLVDDFETWERKNARFTRHEDIMTRVHENMGQLRVLNNAKRTTIDNLRVQLNILTGVLQAGTRGEVSG